MTQAGRLGRPPRRCCLRAHLPNYTPSRQTSLRPDRSSSPPPAPSSSHSHPYQIPLTKLYLFKSYMSMCLPYHFTSSVSLNEFEMARLRHAVAIIFKSLNSSSLMVFYLGGFHIITIVFKSNYEIP